MDKGLLVYPHNGILNNKQEQTIHKCNNMDDSQNDYADGKKPGQKKKNT